MTTDSSAPKASRVGYPDDVWRRDGWLEKHQRTGGAIIGPLWRRLLNKTQPTCATPASQAPQQQQQHDNRMHYNDKNQRQRYQLDHSANVETDAYTLPRRCIWHTAWSAGCGRSDLEAHEGPCDSPHSQRQQSSPTPPRLRSLGRCRNGVPACLKLNNYAKPKVTLNSVDRWAGALDRVARRMQYKRDILRSVVGLAGSWPSRLTNI